jgi:mono/diheme cytochrome c family protein
MKYFILPVVLFYNIAIAYTPYIGYSGAPGSKGYCAQCHGSGTGTIVVLGVPVNYEPSKTYTIIVKRNGGSLMSNFNGSTRVGNTTTVAGTFMAGF